ncbi:MAG: protein kinase [Myxococcota bacterium]|nr:protein kinase [Myxococcota bacterium]
MLLLPKTIGPVTLQRKLGTSGVSESYRGVLVEDGRPVLVRRILPFVTQDRSRLANLQARVEDLMGVSHPLLVPILDWVEAGDERLVVEDFVEAINLERVITWCRQNGQPVPQNIFLNLATQLCSALEVLHGRPGRATGSPKVLHLGLQPAHLFLTPNARVLLGGFSLTRAPAGLSKGNVGSPVPQRLEYLSPEQTWSDQQLDCASDVFSLSAILYEFVTLRPLFRAESSLQTLKQVREASVAPAMVHVQDRLPGLEKVLSRALSQTPAHRYQRAFVLREELRGLMAGYDFSNIVQDTQAFLEPVVNARNTAPPLSRPPQPTPTADHVAAAERIAEKARQERLDRAARERKAAALAAAQDIQEHSDPATDVVEPPAPAQPRPVRPPAPAPFHPIAGGFGDAPTANPTLLPEDEVPGLGHKDETTNVGFTPPPPVPPLPEDRGEVTQAEPPPPPPPVEDRGEPTAALPAPQVRVGPPQGFSDEQPEEVLEALDAPDGSDSGILDEDTDIGPAPDLAETTAALPPPVMQPLAAKPVAPPVEPAPATDPSLGVLHETPGDQPPPPPPVEQSIAPKTPAQTAPPPAPESAPTDDEPPRKRRVWPLVLGGVAAVTLVMCAGLGAAAWFKLKDASEGFEDFAAGLEELNTTEALAEAEADAEPEIEAPEPTEASPEPTSAPTPAPRTTRTEPAVASAPTRRSAEPTAAPTRSSSPPTTREPSSRTSSMASSARRPASTSSSSGAVAPKESRGTSSARSSSDADAMAFLEEPAAPLEDSGLEDPGPDLDAYVNAARSGRLTTGERQDLEFVGTDSLDYTRSRALLLMDAEQREDDKDVKRYLDQLMLLPENRYNSVYLSKRAAWHANHKQYQRALDDALQAERYWARIPSELVHGTKADIYETKAAAYQGLFYASGDDLELLDQSVRAWDAYKRHVSSKGAAAEAERAQAQIDKLEDIRARLE